MFSEGHWGSGLGLPVVKFGGVGRGLGRVEGWRGRGRLQCCAPLGDCNTRLLLARESRFSPGAWASRIACDQVVFSLPLQDKEDGEPKTKQLREGEEEGEKHR